MKQEIKKFNEQERQEYVPASVKVIEVATQGILCASGTGNDEYSPGNTRGWY